MSKKYWDYFKQGVITGFGSAIGATIGLVFISTIVVAILNAAGGLPLVGTWLASIVEVTNYALSR